MVVQALWHYDKKKKKRKKKKTSNKLKVATKWLYTSKSLTFQAA